MQSITYSYFRKGVSMVNLEHYRVFYYVAAYQSITRAAAQLYISQPAVSKSIQRLEEEMNCKLFTRTPHGSVLTPEGTLLYSHVSKAMKEFELGEGKVLRLDSSQRQEIRVGATESALYSTLLPVLARFTEEYPNVSFQIRGCSTSDLVRMLGEGSIDVALGVTPLPCGSTLPITELGELRDVFFAHREYPVDDSIPLTPALMCELPIVGVDTRSSAGGHIAATFQTLGLQYSPAFTVETSTNVLPFVEKKLAIGLAPRWGLKASAAADELRELNTSFSIPPRRIFLASKERRLLSPVCRKFLDTISGSIHS